MRELIYDSYVLFSFNPVFCIVGMQGTNDTFILADNNFANIEKVTIESAKIMTKNKSYFTLTHLLKFNGAHIRLELNGIVLTKDSHLGGILLLTNNVADSTSSRRIKRKKLSLKEQYLAQRAKGANIASMYQQKVSFNLSNLVKKSNLCQMTLYYSINGCNDRSSTNSKTCIISNLIKIHNSLFFL